MRRADRVGRQFHYSIGTNQYGSTPSRLLEVDHFHRHRHSALSPLAEVLVLIRTTRWAIDRGAGPRVSSRTERTWIHHPTSFLE